MTVRMYSSLDAGAPALPNIGSQRLIDNLRLIFQACLVNGYDGKPAAGWSVVHDVADGFSLSNGEGVINFVHRNITAVAIYIMEAVTDGSTALAGGINRRSGPWFDGEANTIRQHLFISLAGSAQNKSWALAADDKTVTLLTQQGVTTVDPPSTSQAMALHFGQYFPVLGGSGFCSLGGSQSEYSGGTLFSTAFCGMVLRHPITGLVGQGASPFYSTASGTGLNRHPTTLLYGSFQPRTAQFYRAGLAGAGVGVSGSASTTQAIYGGTLRGILVDPFICAARLAQVLPALGVTSPSVEDRLRPLTIDGKPLWPLFPNATEMGAFVSLDPDDWGALWS